MKAVAIFIPLVQQNIGNLPNWPTPCNTKSAVYSMDIRVFTNRQLNESQIYSHFQPHMQCFSKLQINNIDIREVDDVYDKTRKSASWTTGPNTMFYTAIDILRHENAYDFVFQMENDVEPLKPNWLPMLEVIIAGNQHASIIGSSYMGDCCWDPTVGACIELSDTIRYHINGNALYNIQNNSALFKLIAQAKHKYPSWSYDVAIYMIYSSQKAKHQRRMKMAYIYHPFIQNYGEYPVPEKLNNAIFIHHSKNEPSMHRLLEKAVATKDGNDNLMITFATMDRLPALLRFIESLESMGNLLVIAWDPELYKFLQGKVQVALYDVSTHLGTSRQFGDKSFFYINAIRFKIINLILKYGVHVFSCDIDVVVSANIWDHLPYEYDLVAQSDARDGIELTESAPYLMTRLNTTATKSFYLNAGVFYARSTSRSISFFSAFWMQLRNNIGINEQDLFTTNIIASRSMKWQQLSSCLFPNGWVYNYRRVCEHTPIVAHLNWHLEYEKRWLFKLAPASPNGRYMRFNFGDIRDNGFSNCRNALRAALGISSILNRTLLIPDFPLVHLETQTVPIMYYFTLIHLQQNFKVTPEDLKYDSLGSLVSTQIDIGYDDLNSNTPVAFKAAKGYFGASEEEINTHLNKGPYRNARVLDIGRLNRRFHQMESLDSRRAFDQKLSEGLQHAGYIKNIIDFTHGAIQKQHGLYNCVHLRLLREFLETQTDTKGASNAVIDTRVANLADVAGARLRKLPLLIITDNDEMRTQIQKELKRHFSNVFFIDQFLPEWEQVTYTDAHSHTTMAKGIIDANVCARAEGDFIGDIMSSYMQHICYIRNQLQKPPCLDFLARVLETERVVF